MIINYSSAGERQKSSNDINIQHQNSEVYFYVPGSSRVMDCVVK